MVMENERNPAGTPSARTTGPGQPGAEPGAGRLKDEFAGAGKEQVRRAGEQVKQSASKMRDEVKQRGADMVGRAQGRVGELVGEGKERAAEQIDSVAEALRSAAGKLREEDNAVVARYAETAAEQIERLTGYLHDREPGVMMRDLENFARRRPEVFIGGLAVAGVVLGRFLRSTGERDWRRRERHADRMIDRIETGRAGLSYDTGRLPEPGETTSGISSAATGIGGQSLPGQSRPIAGQGGTPAGPGGNTGAGAKGDEPGGFANPRPSPGGNPRPGGGL